MIVFDEIDYLRYGPVRFLSITPSLPDKAVAFKVSSELASYLSVADGGSCILKQVAKGMSTETVISLEIALRISGKLHSSSQVVGNLDRPSASAFWVPVYM